MSRSVEDLIDILKWEDPELQVEFMVCRTDGQMVTMDLTSAIAGHVKNMLKMIKGEADEKE